MIVKKVLVKKEKKEFIEDLDRDVTVQKREFYFVKDISQDFSTRFGKIKKEMLQKDGQIKVKGADYNVFTPVFIDQFKGIKRSSQMIPPKDVGLIITETGVMRDSVILDSGTGSGGTACFFAAIAKQVITYDISKENIAIASQNVKDLGLDNVIIKEGDITKSAKVSEKNIDLFLLDIPDPEKAITTAAKVLKLGGFFVSYSPNISQSHKFVNAVAKHRSFIYLKTVEVSERSWKIAGKVAKPSSDSVIHSGFITFTRKVAN